MPFGYRKKVKDEAAEAAVAASKKAAVAAAEETTALINLLEACEVGSVHVCAQLLSKIPPTILEDICERPDGDGNTALHISSRENHKETTLMILGALPQDKGRRLIELRNRKGKTCLDYAKAHLGNRFVNDMLESVGYHHQPLSEIIETCTSMKHFICSVTLNVMKDPVIDMEGNSYDRECIEGLCRGNSGFKSPFSRNMIMKDDLKPNRIVRRAISESVQDIKKKYGSKLYVDWSIETDSELALSLIKKRLSKDFGLAEHSRKLKVNDLQIRTTLMGRKMYYFKLSEKLALGDSGISWKYGKGSKEIFANVETKNAFVTSGRVYKEHMSKRENLGSPTSNEYRCEEGIRQDFEDGYITYDRAKGVANVWQG